MILCFETSSLYSGSDAVTLYKFGFPAGSPGAGTEGRPGPARTILPGARAAAGTATARDQTVSCIHGGLGQSQAAASRPRAAPPATLGPEENLASGGHLRPSWGRTPCPACAPVRSSGPGAADPGAGSHSERWTRRPSGSKAALSFKTSLTPGRGARRRPRRGGQRHPGYRAGDDDGPSGQLQPLWDARLAASWRGTAAGEERAGFIAT